MSSTQPDPHAALRAAAERAANHMVDIALAATDPALRRAAAGAYDSIRTTTNVLTKDIR